MTKPGIRRVCIRDVHGNGIPNGTGNPIGMGIKHRFGNGNGREWETTSVGMGITCTPMGLFIPKGFMLRCAVFADYRNVIYSAPRAGLCIVIIND